MQQQKQPHRHVCVCRSEFPLEFACNSTQLNSIRSNTLLLSVLFVQTKQLISTPKRIHTHTHCLDYLFLFKCCFKFYSFENICCILLNSQCRVSIVRAERQLPQGTKLYGVWRRWKEKRILLQKKPSCQKKIVRFIAEIGLIIIFILQFVIHFKNVCWTIV